MIDGSVAIVIILIFVLFGTAFYTFGDDSADNYIEVSPEVEAYTLLISKYAQLCGYIKSGTVPKFSYVLDIVDWARSHHHWQSRNYKPSPGDIIIIDWYANGTRDHVGLVERCDGKTVYTIEGNRSDAVRRGSYRVGSGTIYGYCVSRY